MKKSLRKLIAVILAIVMVVCAVPFSQLTGINFAINTKAAGETYTSGNYYYTVDEYGNAEIEDVVDTSISGAVEIPSKLDGYPVTTIGSYAFSYCYYITSVVIPEGVKTIDYDAFYYCESLTSVTLPDGLEEIGSYAFEYCSKLTNITIPDSVTSIGSNAFYYCSKLSSINIPENVSSIGYKAFACCISLKSITVDKNNQYYSSDEYGALYDKEKTMLIQYPAGNTATSYTIPDGVTTISDYAFYYCKNLTNVTIPDSVTAIGDYAFYNCQNLTNVTIPDGVTAIGDYTFYECYNLNNITIPEAVTTIGNRAFYYCYNLTSITIPEAVTSIGSYAFYNCDGIISVTIPENVTSVGYYAFAYCDNLSDITILSDTASINKDAFYYTAYYKDTSNWDNNVFFVDGYLVNGYNATGDYVVKDGTRAIGASAFSSADITSITIPDSVTAIGDSAFHSADYLTSVTIPENVKFIGDNAFGYCSKLDSVTIKGNDVAIGDKAFYYCYNLTSVTFTGTGITFGDYVFYYCDELTSIAIPDNSTLGEYVFYDCYNLATITAGKNIKGLDKYDINYTAFYSNESNWTNGILYISDCLVAVNSSVKGTVTIKNGVVEIPDGIFTGMAGITEVVLPNTVEYIGDSAFMACLSLAKINIPENVKYIGVGAFALCLALTDVTIPSSVESLEAGTFLLCIGLESVSLPASITTIPELTFAGCVKLKNAPISNVIEIGAAAFLGCADFTSVNIGAAVNSIGMAAFAGCTSVEKFIVDSANTYFTSDSYGALFTKDMTALLTYPSASATTAYAIPETVGIMDFAFVSCKNLETLNIPANYGTYGEESLLSLFVSTIAMKVDFEELINKIASLGAGLLDYVSPLLGLITGSDGDITVLQVIADIVNDALDYICSIENADAAISMITDLISDVLTSATLDNFKSFTVTDGNPLLYAKDGMLYIGSDGVNGLLACPAGKTGTVKLDSKTNAIAPAAFALCNVDEIVIPSNVSELLPLTFVLCDAGKVTVPSTVQVADALAFGLGKFGILEIANGSKIFELESESEYSPFLGCIADKIVLPDSLEEIPSNYFMICLAKEYKLPKNLKIIGNQSFVGNVFLEKLDIPDSVENIGQSAFLASIMLTDVNVSENSKLKSIGEMAFTATSLSDFFVPAGTENIGTLALNPSVGGAISSVYELIRPELEYTLGMYKEYYGIDFNVEKINATVGHVASWFTKNAGVTVDARNPYFSSLNGDLYNYDKSNLIKVAETATGLYEIEPSVINIGAGAFSFTGVNEIIVPNSVTTIEAGAFSLAPVKEISLGTGIKEIPAATFSECTLLERVTILPSVVSIADDAFEGCSNEITIVGYQDSYAYYYAVDNEINFESIDGKGYVSMKAPSEVASTSVPVYGHAVPNTLVEIYDDGVKIGEIVSAENGYWRTTVNLDNPVNNQTNVLVAKINSGTDNEVVSKEVNVLYTTSAPTFESITCYHGSQNRTITMDTLGVVPQYMSFSSSNSFTYEIKLSAYDGNKTLYVVSGGKKLPAIYDARTDRYIATGYFDEENTSYVPEYVTIELGGCVLANTSFRFPFIIDPSGFVYEAVHSNRVEGATASIYYKDDNGFAKLWEDAPIFDQVSTIITGEDGIFKWDVPNGLWQVKVDKEGYETAYSEWLPVPPEQLEVYIGLITKLAPTVSLVDGYTDGIDVVFNQYMDIDTVNTNNIDVTDSDGNYVYGYWDATNEEVSGTDRYEYYASEFTFIPYYDSLDGEYTITINGVKNYAGKAIEAEYIEKVTVKDRVSTLNIPDSLELEYGKDYTDSDENKIFIDGGVVAAGKTVNVTLSNNFYVESVTSVTLDDAGRAVIAVNPVTPGTTTMTFNLEGTRLVEEMTVVVGLPQDVKATGVEISDSEIELNSGSEKQLYAKVAPDFATNVAVVWSSSDSSVATVDESGRVKGIKQGVATITVTTVDGGFTATCTVNVLQGSLIGDVDNDGKVNQKDRATLTRYLANWTGYTADTINMAAADVNGDNKVNQLDRTILTRHIANWTGYENLPYKK